MKVGRSPTAAAQAGPTGLSAPGAICDRIGVVRFDVSDGTGATSFGVSFDGAEIISNGVIFDVSVDGADILICSSWH